MAALIRPFCSTFFSPMVLVHKDGFTDSISIFFFDFMLSILIFLKEKRWVSSVRLQCTVMIGSWLYLDLRLLRHDMTLLWRFLLCFGSYSERWSLFYFWRKLVSWLHPSPSSNFYMDFYRILYGSNMESPPRLWILLFNNEEVLCVSHDAGAWQYS